MKNLSIILGAIILASFCLVGCVQNTSKQNELTPKEKELAIIEKDTSQKKSAILEQNSVKKVTKSEEDSSGVYNFGKHSDIQVFWNDFKKAVLSKDIENTKKMCIIPIPSYYYESKDKMNVSRLFEKEFTTQIKKINELKKIKIMSESSEVSKFNLKINTSVYQLKIDGWEYSGAILYFTVVDGKYKLVGVQSYEAEG